MLCRRLKPSLPPSKKGRCKSMKKTSKRTRLIGLLTVSVTLATLFSLMALSNATPPSLISSDDALMVAAQAKGWSATQISSYKSLTELRYLEQNGDWLEIYVADPETGNLLKHEQSLSLKIPDPVVNLRGYFWFVSITTNTSVSLQEVSHYSHLFWINATNSKIAHTISPR
jgi:hypothetical protein